MTMGWSMISGGREGGSSVYIKNACSRRDEGGPESEGRMG